MVIQHIKSKGRTEYQISGDTEYKNSDDTEYQKKQ
jgi:hypothetical protein